MPVSPSVFVRCEAESDRTRAGEGAFFRCTACGSTALEEGEDALVCGKCEARFPVRDGIYDFREPDAAGDIGDSVRNG